MAQELHPEVIGPPGYASPDPETDRGRLVPVEEHPLTLADDYGESVADAADVVALDPRSQSVVEGGGGVVDISDFNKETTKKDWQAAAKSRGLSTSGDKDAIRKRIEAHDEETATRADEDAEVRKLKRDELDGLAKDYDIDPEEYSTVDLLADAVIAAAHGEEVPAGDKPKNDNTNQ